MQAVISLATFAALVAPSLAAAVPHIHGQNTGVKVELSQGHNTKVHAVMINTGSETLKLLNYGTLMDKNPVQKLNVFKNGQYCYLHIHSEH
jgi:Deuterolysin metalloprotease (M35) family